MQGHVYVACHYFLKKFLFFFSAVCFSKLRAIINTDYACALCRYAFPFLSRDSYLLPPLMKSLSAFVIAHELLELTMLGLQCRAQRGNFPT